MLGHLSSKVLNKLFPSLGVTVINIMVLSPLSTTASTPYLRVLCV